MPDFIMNPPLDQLKTIGDPHDLRDWNEASPDPDYVTALGLRPEHVPELIRIAQHWSDGSIEWPEDDPDLALYAPVHAWRALAQLRATEAVAPLLDMIASLDAMEDDWYLDEFPSVFGMIGAPAFEPVNRYLANLDHGEFPRICAASGLVRMAERHPDMRDQVVAALTAALEKYVGQPDGLNGSLIADLLDLNAAVPVAELIERAFAANKVDSMICGYWGKLKQELGVPGLGLASEEIPENPWTLLRNDLLNPFGDQKLSRRGPAAFSSPIHQANKQNERKKAKRKQEKKSRKRNRRR